MLDQPDKRVLPEKLVHSRTHHNLRTGSRQRGMDCGQPGNQRVFLLREITRDDLLQAVRPERVRINAQHPATHSVSNAETNASMSFSNGSTSEAGTPPSG